MSREFGLLLFGAGPSDEQMRAAWFKLSIVGQCDGKTVRTGVSGAGCLNRPASIVRDGVIAAPRRARRPVYRLAALAAAGLIAAGCWGCSAYDPSSLDPSAVPRAGAGGTGLRPVPGTDAGGGAQLDAAPLPPPGKDAGNTPPPDSGVGSGCAGAGAVGTCGDECPADLAKTAPGQCGCGVSDVDGDGDGTADCVDLCPDDPDKTAPGACDCGRSDADEDDDGSSDCVDGCPQDPNKTAAGDCGCGMLDSGDDMDTDGTIDCVDACPNDPGKTAPGMCDCGTPDTDGDGDDTPDCMDQCPADPNKQAPGQCGCGVADGDGTTVGCVALRDALVRRYRFDGTGTEAVDSKGGTSGTIAGGATLMDTGALVLAGGTSMNQYVDLPNGVLSALQDATIEVWLIWNGGAIWQRVFDFGTSGTENSQGTGMSYLFLTPSASSNLMRLTFSTSGSANETRVDSARILPTGVLCHLAVVIDDTNDTMAFYLNTTLEGSVAFTGHLAGINDVNNWIGRSQFSNDPELGATVQEFRIYDAALTPAQLDFSLTHGPDPAYLE